LKALAPLRFFLWLNKKGVACDAACLNLGSSFQTDDNRMLKPLLFGDGFSIALKKKSV
jgi:hypothetical protein